MSLLRAENLSVRFGGLLAVGNASLEVPEGGLVGLIGPNGAGKTTLFALLSGFLTPDTGSVRFAGADITREPPHLRAARGMVRTFQIVQPFAGLSVRENIAVGAWLRHNTRAAAIAAAEAVAREVGLAPMLDVQATALTVAGRKRLELARALATGPRLLLLDEVLAGLNPSELRDILPVIRGIRERGIAILMIEHVMQAVMNLCDHIHVLASGRIIASGSPRAIAADPGVIEAYLGRGAAARLAAGGARA